jgi:hypothetical protein
MDKEALHIKQNYCIERIERLRGGAIDRLGWEKIYKILDELSEGVPLVVQPVGASSKFARGRILSAPDEIHSVKDLTYPPAANCNTYGRCNKPGVPVFYAGIGAELIFSEIGAQIGDIVGLMHMSPLTDVNCARLGALELWRRTSGHCLLPENIKNLVKEIHLQPENITAFLFDAFITDYFSRLASDSVYKLTSAYTSVVFDSNPNVEGIIYESVNHTAGSCVVVKPDVVDTKLIPTEIQLVRVTNFLGYGVYDYEIIKHTNKFDEEHIVW